MRSYIQRQRRTLTSKDSIARIGIFVIVFVIAGYFSLLGIDPHHDGIIFKPALDVANGKILFKETYTSYGGLSVFLNSGLLLLFGKKLIVLKIFSAFLYGIIASMVWMISRRYSSFVASLASILIFIGVSQYFTHSFYPWPSILGAFFLVLAQLLFAFYSSSKAFLRRNWMPLFSVGVCCGLAFWSKQPYFLAIPAVVILYFLLWMKKVISFRQLLSNSIVVIAGFFIVTCFFLSIIIFQGAFHDWFLQSIRLGYTMGRIFSSSFTLPSLFYSLTNNPWHLLIPIATFFTLFSIVSKKSKKQTTFNSVSLLGITALSLASICQFYPIFDTSHVYWAIIPGFGILGYFLDSLYSFIKLEYKQNSYVKYINLLIIFLIVIIMILSIVSNIIKGVQKATRPYITLKTPFILEGMKGAFEEKVFFEELSTLMVEYFRNHPKKSFVILGGDSLYMAMTDRAHSTGPLYLDFTNFVSKIYPYTVSLNTFIQKEKPLILITELPPHVPKEYKVVKQWSQFHAMLIMPIKDRE